MSVKTKILSKTLAYVIKLPSFHWSPFFRCVVYNNPTVKFTHSLNHTEHYRK